MTTQSQIQISDIVTLADMEKALPIFQAEHAILAAKADKENVERHRQGQLKVWIDVIEARWRFFRVLGIDPAMITEGASQKQIDYALAKTGGVAFSDYDSVCEAIESAPAEAQAAIRSAATKAAKDARFWLNTLTSPKDILAFATDAASDYL